MFLYNSLTRTKEELHSGDLRLFVCGPTVYDVSHLGHARTYLTFDFLVKYLRATGRKITYLQNITDIDDKIIARAQKEKTTPETIAKKYTEAYLEDMKAIGINSVDHYAPATKFIPQIIKQVQTLLDKGFGYKIESDGIYFDISKFPDYGKLSGRTVEQAEDSVSRIDQSVNKKNKGDFALWKLSKPGEPVWKAPFGAGRPGWHIEDTAISEYYFGPQYEMHGGGMDLKFPHHEAEIAQEESMSDKKPFVEIWLHTGTLTIGGQKMSKSLGNVFTIHDFIKEHGKETLMFMVLSNHWRSPLDVSKKLIRDSKENVNKIKLSLAKMRFAAKKAPAKGEELHVEDNAILSALNDDMNTPKAVGHFFSDLSRINENIWKVQKDNWPGIIKSAEKWMGMFGIETNNPKIPLRARWYASHREKYRASQQFEQSDALRKKAEGLGYIIEDTPQGPFLWPKHLN